MTNPLWRNKRLRYVFLACVIVLAVAAVLLYAFKITRSETAVVFLCIALGVAAVAVVLSMVMSRVVLKPVSRLSEASQQIARGDFDLNLTYEGAIEEFRDTYRSFNTMARELRSIETLRADFIANVSHEFKTPLTAIEGYAMLLQDRGLTEGERADCTQRILDSAGRLSALVSNILLLSKLEQQTASVEKAPFRLDEQIRQVMVELEPLWGPKELELELELPPLRYEGSESLLYHVWSNLLSNAVKFSPQGGALTVTLAEAEEYTVQIQADRFIGSYGFAWKTF